MVWSEVLPYDWSPKDTVYFSSCAPTWSARVQLYSAVFNFVCLYLVPLAFMLFTYCQIVRVLWKPAIPGRMDSGDYSGISGESGSGNFRPETRDDSAMSAVRVVLSIQKRYFI